MSSAEVVAYYHDLWHVEQAFRISKSDDLPSHPGSHQGPHARLLYGLDDGQIPGDQYETIITPDPERALAGS
jgi:hypothetical protein